MNTTENLLEKSFKYIDFYICIRDEKLNNTFSYNYIKNFVKSTTNELIKNKKMHHEYLFHICSENKLPPFIIKCKNKIEPYFVYSCFQNQFLKYDSFYNIYNLMIDSEIIVCHIKLRLLLH